MIQPRDHLAETGQGESIELVFPRLSQQLGGSLKVAELANAAGTTGEPVLEALEAGRGQRTSSLDVPDRDGQSLAELVGSEDSHLAHVEDRSVFAMALETLSHRDHVILRLRFGDGLTQSEIAARLGVGQMQIGRSLDASFELLRDAFGETGSHDE